MADRGHQAESAIVERRNESSGKSLGLRFVEGTVRNFGRHVNVPLYVRGRGRRTRHTVWVSAMPDAESSVLQKYRSFPAKGCGRRSFGRWLLAPPLLARAFADGVESVWLPARL